MSEPLVTQAQLEGLLRRLRDLEQRLGRTETRERPGVSSAYTPTYLGGTTLGATTYTAQGGNYTRVGNVVVVQGRVTWTAATGTGQARISLPFTAAFAAPAPIWTSNVTFGALTPYGLVQAGVNYLTIWTPANNAASAAIAVEAAGDIQFQATYLLS